ncbi:PTAR1 [Branchiostoma lanceolatum]|uniref:PTAR1 protein n=1 Tax=Branchiostoma lanceolatum TaxID=7740 RepID=A0A8J9ZGM1_BRALA|nr:PTAR1 [Branchiostoma lanceolatum]
MAHELAHRILSDLSTAFQRHPNIDEVGFICCPTCQHNRSPVVVENNKLGIETWCLELIFPYAHDKVLRARGRDDRGRKIKVSRSARSLLEATRAVLLVQADCLTAWNIRKELVEAEDLKCTQDLKFAALVLTKHPKSSETFAHRRWLLKQIIQKTTSTSVQPSPIAQASHTNGLVAGDQASSGAAVEQPLNTQHGTKAGGTKLPCDEKLLETELTVCQSSAERYPSNYYAWTHRAWVVENVARCHYKILMKELCDNRHWISRHISDHSGLQYRQFLLTQLATHFRLEDALQDEFLPVLTAEFELLTDLITAFPGHEALWYHRRYVFQQWESVLSMFKCPKSDNSASSKNHTHLQQQHCSEVPVELYTHSASSFSRDRDDSKLHAAVVQGNKKAKVDSTYTEHHTIQTELEFCRNIMATSQDGWQVRLAGSYQHWLQQRILGQDNKLL